MKTKGKEIILINLMAIEKFILSLLKKIIWN